jgi:hypothetical protein
MLKDAVTINSFDLQTIRMLPITSPTDAIQPPLMNTLVYSPPTTCKDKPYDKSCDPFANIPVKKPIDPDILWQTLLAMFGGLIILSAVYFAIKYASDKNWGLWLKNKVMSMKNVSPVAIVAVILLIGGIISFIIPVVIATGALPPSVIYALGGTFLILSLVSIFASFTLFRTSNAPAGATAATATTATTAAAGTGLFTGTNPMVPGAGTGLVVPGAGTGLIPPTTTTTTRKITPKRTTFANKGPVANPIQQALKNANKSGITMPDMRTPEQIARDLASAQVKNRIATSRLGMAQSKQYVPFFNQVTSSTPGRRRNVSSN